ncbi:iron-sulfur cluster assembly accessory protein [Paraburkholderia sp. CNPSo 3157]|nr:iron-sulfur cluster assembly accessory protein [Paraburkholderia franconis]
MVQTLLFLVCRWSVKCDLPSLSIIKKLLMVAQRSTFSVVHAPDIPTFTPRAAAKFAELITLRDETQLYIRLRAEMRGADDIKYSIVLDDSVGDSDIEVITQGITVFIDNASLQHLAGARIDYDERALHPRFVIDSRDASAFCARSKAFSSCPR